MGKITEYVCFSKNDKQKQKIENGNVTKHTLIYLLDI